MREARLKARLVCMLPAILLLISAAAECTTFTEMTPPAKGSVLNPVRCDMPMGQREYLKRLRTKKGDKVDYEYLDSVMGPDGHILDRFLIANPDSAHDDRSPFEIIADEMREKPKLPRKFRIYMDMYRPGERDDEPIPGFSLLKD